MKKKLLIIIPLVVLIIAVLGAASYALSHGFAVTKGIYLAADNGASLFIDEHGPVRMTDCTRKGNVFADLATGNEILVIHDGIQESYPGGTGAYFIIKTGEGSPELIPQAAADSLRELGWIKNEADEAHQHQVASVPQISEPEEPNVYCGNTQTTFIINGMELSIMYGNSVAVTDMLRTMTFDPQKLCKCLPEFEIRTEFSDETYGVNLTQGYVRSSEGQAELTQEQIDLIKEARNEAVTATTIID